MRVSATLLIGVRERFVSAACRLFIFWKRCSVYSVVLEQVVLSRLEVRRCGRDQQGDDMADHMTDHFHAHNDDAAILSRLALEPQAGITCSCL